MGKSRVDKPQSSEQLEHLYKPSGRNSPWYKWRVPVNYYPASGQVVTGDPGDFHSDIALPYGGDYWTGMIGLKGRKGPEGEEYTPGFTWLDNRPRPDQHKAVVNTLAQHYPEATTPFVKGEPNQEDYEWGDDYVPGESRINYNNHDKFRLGFGEANGVNLIQTKFDEGADTSLNNRIPFIYHHPTGNLFMGRNGYFHNNIKQSPEYRQGVGGFPHPATEGWIWTNEGSVGHEEPFPDERTRHTVLQTLQSYMGSPLDWEQPMTHEDWADLMEN